MEQQLLAALSSASTLLGQLQVQKVPSEGDLENPQGTTLFQAHRSAFVGRLRCRISSTLAEIS